MFPSRPRQAAFALLFTGSMFISGCLATVEDTCNSLADTHCTECFSCADGVDGLSGAELCDVPSRDGTSLADCRASLQRQCEQQARTLQDPFDELDQCETAIEAQTCNELIEREALDQPSAPRDCRRFL